jgi:hypothetical protein
LFCICFEIGLYCVAQAGLELLILLPQPSKCWLGLQACATMPNYDDRFFFFLSVNNLNILSSFLLASSVFANKLAGDPNDSLLGMSHFSLAAFRILPLSSGDLVRLLCPGMDLWVYPPWSSLSFLSVCIHVFPQIWELFSNCFFK